MRFIVHGHWSPSAGFVLWFESGTPDAATASGSPAAPSRAPAYPTALSDAAVLRESLGDALFSRHLAGVLERTRGFRHRLTLSLPDPGAAPGSPRNEAAWEVPCLALPAPRAVALLRAAAGDGEGADIAIAPDLRFFAGTLRDVEAYVDAGHVLPRIVEDDEEFWARWRLPDTTAAWLSARADTGRALPRLIDVFHRSGRDVAPMLAECVEQFTDEVVRGRLATGAEDRETVHPLLRALVEEAPIALPRAEAKKLQRDLELWERSRVVPEAPEHDFLLRLHEPEEAGDEEFPTDDDAPRGRVPAPASGPGWLLEACLRLESGEIAPVAGILGSPGVLREATAGMAVALRAFPELHRIAGSGGFEHVLNTHEVGLLLVAGSPALAEAGVTLLLPREWTKRQAALRLSVGEPEDAGQKAPSKVGLDQLADYDWQLSLGETTLSPEEMAELAENQSELVRLRGEWIRVDATVLAAAARYVQAQAAQGSRASLGRLLGRLTADGGPPVPVEEVNASGRFAALFDSGEHREIREIPTPGSLRATLRPYQLRGLSWLAFMSSLGLGAVLADDMGLGKTIQLLALLCHEREESEDRIPPTLLVCPMSVVGNWQREADKFVPGLRVLVHHGAGRLKDDALAAAAGEADLVITSYSLLARDSEALQKIDWGRLVLDEAQYVKNSGTSQARAARALPAAHRVALTGTPVENRLGELRSILNFVNPGLLGSAKSFQENFATPIERHRDEKALGLLRRLTEPFILRRVKTDPSIIDDLPAKFEMTVRANLTEEQAALYEAVVKDMLEQVEGSDGMARKGLILASLTRLKQVCNHPAHFLADGTGILKRGKHRSGKLALIDDILGTALDDGEKVLLFTQFRQFGDMLVPYWSQKFGVEVPYLHGGVVKKKRDAMVERFQADGGPPLMLLSLKAGGTGLNLTAANHVVHVDRWWNPAVENQATDRAFRIGQRRNVQVRKMVSVGTVEERVDEIISGKQGLADMTLGTGEGWITELSTEGLRELFALGREAVGE